MAYKVHEYLSAAFNLAGAGTRDVVAAPGAGLAIWVFGVFGAIAANATVQLIDSTPGDHSGDMPLFVAGDNTICLPIVSNPYAPWFRCADNTLLQFTLGAGGDFDGIVVYAAVPADLA